ncbi:MAG: hypothetical protein LBJ23_05990, partial [Tannerella sp.]|nr:hypothetical protein [Tannerella sp.]
LLPASFLAVAMTGLAGGFMLCTSPCSGKTFNSTSKKELTQFFRPREVYIFFVCSVHFVLKINGKGHGDAPYGTGNLYMLLISHFLT